MKIFATFLKEYISFLIGFIVIFLLLYFVAVSNRGVNVTDKFFDPIRTTTNRPEVIVVGIDDASLQKIGAWPWDRKVFAEVTEKLSQLGAKSIVYDVLFLERRSGDEEFKKVLDTVFTNVVLGSKMERDKYYTSFLDTSSNTQVVSAIANVTPDDDGKVRRYPKAVAEGDKCIFGMARTAFNLFTFDNNKECEVTSDNLFRYPEKIQEYSLIDVLSGKIDEDKIKGKVVFIGSTSLDLEDHFVGINGEKIAGVFVHASIFTSLLNKVNDRGTTGSESALLILLFIIITGFLLYKTKTILGQVLVIIGVILSVLLISFLSFSYGVQFPAPWLIAVVLITGGYVVAFRFIKEKKKSEYIEGMFSKYVHKDVLKELMKSSSDIRFDGEKREMTILFSDLRGFTTVAETLEPEELTKMLNGYLSAMTPCILEQKGTIDKFIGDAVMAFWNAPLFVEDHATHAVSSALSMQEALKKFNLENNTKLVMGIGIHTGNVIVGNVGSKERVNYTILGDAVNLTSRIEGLTKKYCVECIITEEVKNKITDKNIIFRKLDIITVKGKNLPTVLYEIKRNNDKDSRTFLLYDKAYNSYQNRDFDEAERIFTELKGEGDSPSEIILERLVSVRKNDDWDGVYHFDEK